MSEAAPFGELLPCVDFTGPRRALRAVYSVAVGILVVALGSPLVVQTDVVVRAAATVAPAGETARVQALRGGKVAEILVAEGDRVDKGQPLVRLDRRHSKGRVDILAAQSEAAAARVKLLEALQGSRASAYEMEGRIRGLEGAELSARASAARSRVVAREREGELRARTEARSRWLAEHDSESKSSAEKAEMEAAIARAEAEAARAAVDELESSRRKASVERARVRQDSTVASLSDGVSIASARAELERLKGDLAEAQIEHGELEIVAPRAGVVHALAVFDPGDVLPPGAFVADVVPEQEELVIKAEVPADGIAFVRNGQPARVKLDAYPFQDFGVLRGTVVRVAADASHADGGAKPPATFTVRIGVTGEANATGGQLLRLRAGMTGQAELTVRRENLALALLRPLRGTFDSVRN